ncbi:8119_t:CDS:2 [Funneliformis caledonium]|uniref:8119_t:CDS:1 n=1 Tax=Funneliformis caledonium TaxID=1117310 RepID=A0A9N9HZE9_9GLOM|nr:8119_t:CDS:2 [Funneliformis caledonium]
MEQLRVITSGSQKSPSIKEREKKIVVEAVEEDRNSLNNSFSNSESISSNNESIILKKRKCYNKFRDVIFDGQYDESEQVPIEESSDEECFEIPPGDEESFSTNDDIFKYQARFRLSDVAIDSLIKFFRMVLLDVNQLQFEKFPTSSYMAKKFLGIGKQEVTFAVCSSYNTLYKVTEILSTGHKYTHVEYLNHPMRNQKRPCRTELTNKILVNNGFVRRPKMLFPIPSLKMQIMTMYQRSGFKELLHK